MNIISDPMKNTVLFVMLLCGICSNSLYAQVLTDWEVYGLKGKVKQTIEITISEVSHDKKKFVTHYDEYGFVENVSTYSLVGKDDEEIYLGKIVYEKYVRNQRKAFTFNEKERKVEGISYGWTVNDATKLYTAKFGDLVTEAKPTTVISVFNAKNQKESEKLLTPGRNWGCSDAAVTIEKLFEYDEKGYNIGYEQIKKVEQENYLDEKKSFKLMNETFDEMGNVTKQQIMLNGKLFSTIVYVYSYY